MVSIKVVVVLTIAPGQLLATTPRRESLAGESLKFVTGGPYVNPSNVRTVVLAQGLAVWCRSRTQNGRWFGLRPEASRTRTGVVIEFDTARSDSGNVFAPEAPLQVTVPGFTAAPTGAPPLVSPTLPEFVDVIDRKTRPNGFPGCVNIV